MGAMILVQDWERYISTEGELLDRGFRFDDAPPDQAQDEGRFQSVEQACERARISRRGSACRDLPR